jgi:hypothetical protein
MSSDNKAEISIDDVEVLMSNLQRQIEQHPTSSPIAGAEEQPVLAPGTVFGRTMELTHNLSPEENTGTPPSLLHSWLSTTWPRQSGGPILCTFNELVILQCFPHALILPSFRGVVLLWGDC